MVCLVAFLFLCLSIRSFGIKYTSFKPLPRPAAGLFNGEGFRAVVASHQDEEIIEEYRKSKKFLNIFSHLDENHNRVLTFYGLMLAGAIARSVAATAIHPLTVVKTILQCRDGKMPKTWDVLSRGAGAQFIMSIPHGALSFVVTETMKKKMAAWSKRREANRVLLSERFLNPLLDFLASAIATFVCTIISTPQMVLTDRIMSGLYANLFVAVPGIMETEGVSGFYLGWLPALVQKIPSYALTWMFFQQFKQGFHRLMERSGTAVENTFMGALAASVACCIMIPVDTIKTRIVTQRPGMHQYYDGMYDCFDKIIKQEGVSSLYRALPPRLMSVVPMTGIQYGVYELMKRLLIGEPPPKKVRAASIALTLKRKAKEREEAARRLLEKG